jgi:hypothetical protein
MKVSHIHSQTKPRSQKWRVLRKRSERVGKRARKRTSIAEADLPEPAPEPKPEPMPTELGQ